MSKDNYKMIPPGETDVVTKFSDILLGPERLPEENFKTYKERQKNEGALLRMYLKGRLIHDSKDGPYKREC